MKKFDLQQAIDGHPLVTRDGREVTEFHYFQTANDPSFVIVAVINGKTIHFDENGTYVPYGDSKNDLFLKDQKTKYYFFSFKRGDGESLKRYFSPIYTDENAPKKYLDDICINTSYEISDIQHHEIEI